MFRSISAAAYVGEETATLNGSDIVTCLYARVDVTISREENYEFSWHGPITDPFIVKGYNNFSIERKGEIEKTLIRYAICLYTSEDCYMQPFGIIGKAGYIERCSKIGRALTDFFAGRVQAEPAPAQVEPEETEAA